MYCTTCGNLLREGEKVCSVCGTPVADEPVAPVGTPAPTDSAENYAPADSTGIFATTDSVGIFDTAESAGIFAAADYAAAPAPADPAQTSLFEEASAGPALGDKLDFSWESDAFHNQDFKGKTEDIEFKWNVGADSVDLNQAASITAAADDQAAEAKARQRTEESATIFNDDTFHLRTTEEEDVKLATEKKNEEFQELLDAEFEKIQERQAEIDAERSRIGEVAQAPADATPSVLVTGETAREAAEARIQEYLRKADLEMQQAIGGQAAHEDAASADITAPVHEKSYSGEIFSSSDDNDANVRAFGFKHEEDDITWEFEHSDYDPEISAIKPDDVEPESPGYLSGKPIEAIPIVETAPIVEVAPIVEAAPIAEATPEPEAFPEPETAPSYDGIFVTDFANPFDEDIAPSVPEEQPSAADSIFDTDFANPFADDAFAVSVATVPETEAAPETVVAPALATDYAAPIFEAPAFAAPGTEPQADVTPAFVAPEPEAIAEAPVFVAPAPEPAPVETPVFTTPTFGIPTEEVPSSAPGVPEDAIPAPAFATPEPPSLETPEPPSIETPEPPAVAAPAAEAEPAPAAEAEPAAVIPPIRPAPVTEQATAPISTRRHAPDIVNKPVVFPFDDVPEKADKDMFTVPASRTPEAFKPDIAPEASGIGTATAFETAAGAFGATAAGAGAAQTDSVFATGAAGSADASKPEDSTADKSKVPRRKTSKALVVIVDILIIVAIILAVCFALVKFVPDSGAAELIKKGFSKVTAVTGIGGDESAAADPEDADEETAKDDGYIMPISDGDTLISSQLFNNYNIGEVVYDPSASWQKDVNYPIEGAAAAKPIEDDHWKDGPAGPLLYDESAVAAVIRFDSGLVEYINSKDTGLLDSIAVGSAAEQKLAKYMTSVTQISVDRLGIGNIRRNGDDLYVWTNESVTETKGGAPMQSTVMRLYRLTPDEDSYKVSDFEDIG
jgi:hypothetical protein